MAVVNKDYDHLKSILTNKSFQKRIDLLAKKYEGKKIVIYGAGLLFSVIEENYDLSKLNVIALADQKFYDDENFDYKGFKGINSYELDKIDFDVILLSTYLSFDAIKTIKNDILPGRNCTIEPFLKKNLFERLEEKLIELTN